MNSLSPSSSGNVNLTETKLNSLERENFDLKLRLHYLNKKFLSNEVDENGPINSTIEENIVELETLRDENEYLKRRIIELESELLQIQLIRDKERNDYHKLLQGEKSSQLTTQDEDESFIDENRKREREVAMAIAEHDAAIIAKLQDDLTQMYRQREYDVEIIQNLTRQVAVKQEVIEDKEKDLSNNRKRIQELTEMLDNLKDQKRLLELQASTFQRTHNTIVQTHPSLPYPANNGPVTVTTNSNGQQTSIVINGHDQNSQNSQSSIPKNFNTDSLKPSMNSQPQDPSNLIIKLSDSSIHYENKLLKEQLLNLQDSLKHQEYVINNMKESSNELYNLEKEENKRLETELQNSLEEKEKLRILFHKLEIELELKSQQILQYRRMQQLSENTFSEDPSQFDNNQFGDECNVSINNLPRNQRTTDRSSLILKAYREKQEIENYERALDLFK